MTAVRQPGKINNDTDLIDIGMENVNGVAAVYLIRGQRTCLIDGGTRPQAPRLRKLLSQLDAFPPDLIIVTHPHYDHSQGIPRLREAAARQGKRIEVMASGAAVPLLADARFNDIFDHGPYDSIRDVTPVQEGDLIDLGGVALRIYDIPGHCRGHVAVLDEKNRNVFVGDALGLKLGDSTYLPPFMPGWEPDAFLASVNKLKSVPYETLCMAHFGCFSGDEARSIPDEAIDTYRKWWPFYERHADKLNDTGYLVQAMRRELNPGMPDFRPATLTMKVMVGLLLALAGVAGRKAAVDDRLTFGLLVGNLAKGYGMYTRT